MSLSFLKTYTWKDVSIDNMEPDKLYDAFVELAELYEKTRDANIKHPITFPVPRN